VAGAVLLSLFELLSRPADEHADGRHEHEDESRHGSEHEKET
jgi:hypothetical protein